MPAGETFTNPPRIVGADGRPVASAPVDRRCPRCHAAPDHRRLSGGFGAPHDVCGRCGHDFEERTL